MTGVEALDGGLASITPNEGRRSSVVIPCRS